ncbi:hypothetical protein [Candidatus Nitrosotenuis cloacae]|uniref:hypothetical protein n=1 Tax=Candidatus Nitrosotenuis cloacae TaxID=1603555 RepID=UPI002280344A|nr:hypothetical protein [Candidatus Nitrosotenuis cloacae]
MSKPEINIEEAELVHIMSRLPEFSGLDGAEIDKIRHEISHGIADVLTKYYIENTRGQKAGWTAKFEQAGISEDDAKSAISCARRLGIEIA